MGPAHGGCRHESRPAACSACDVWTECSVRAVCVHATPGSQRGRSPAPGTPLENCARVLTEVCVRVRGAGIVRGLSVGLCGARADPRPASPSSVARLAAPGQPAYSSQLRLEIVRLSTVERSLCSSALLFYEQRHGSNIRHRERKMVLVRPLCAP
jgi:hypothetical protein